MKSLKSFKSFSVKRLRNFPKPCDLTFICEIRLNFDTNPKDLESDWLKLNEVRETIDRNFFFMYNMSYASINKSQIYSQPSRKRHVDVAKKKFIQFWWFLCEPKRNIWRKMWKRIQIMNILARVWNKLWLGCSPQTIIFSSCYQKKGWISSNKLLLFICGRVLLWIFFALNLLELLCYVHHYCHKLFKRVLLFLVYRLSVRSYHGTRNQKLIL